MACNLESICCLPLLVNLAQFILGNNNVSSSPQKKKKKKTGIEKFSNIDADKMAAERQVLMTNSFSNQSSE